MLNDGRLIRDLMAGYIALKLSQLLGLIEAESTAPRPLVFVLGFVPLESRHLYGTEKEASNF